MECEIIFVEIPKMDATALALFERPSIFAFMSDLTAIPNDLETCQQMLVELFARIDALELERSDFRHKIAELELAMRRILEGKRRETFHSPNQKLLPFPDDPEWNKLVEEARAEAEQIAETITYERRVRRESKPREEKFPENLRRVVVDMPVPKSVANCSEHGPRKIIRYDEVESLHWQRPELYVEVRRFPVMVCEGFPGCGIVSPERPVGVCEGDRIDASVAVTVVNQKFGFYLPYYRQQDIFAAAGWSPSRSTLDNLADGIDFLLEPLYERMRSELLKDAAIGLDDTHVTLLLPPILPTTKPRDRKTERLLTKIKEAVRDKKKSLDAKMWVYCGLVDKPYNIFDFRVSRHRDGPQEFLEGYGGHVMADCYSGNLSVILAPGSSMVRMACFVHARRHMFQASTNFPKETSYPLALMSQLFDIETRGKNYSTEARLALRHEESQRVLDRLWQWVDGPIARDALPKSSLASAVKYLRNHREALSEYLRDGRLPLDNNYTESLMRQIATGRKNWLFMVTLRAGERNARLMSVVSSAHRNDLDTEQYLTDVVRRITSGSTDYAAMLPDVWKKTHPEAVRRYRVEERRDQAERAKLRAALRRRIPLKKS
jgi:transposase